MKKYEPKPSHDQIPSPLQTAFVIDLSMTPTAGGGNTNATRLGCNPQFNILLASQSCVNIRSLLGCYATSYCKDARWQSSYGKQTVNLSRIVIIVHQHVDCQCQAGAEYTILPSN